MRFLEDCSFGANEYVCRCVLDELQGEYSEETYLELDADLQKNVNHPDFISFLSKAIKKCDTKYAKKGSNNDYAQSGSANFSDALIGIFSELKSLGSMKVPSEGDIIMGDGSSRSAADIMKTIRQHTPELRHIHNEFVKIHPGLHGKITLKFRIAPSGDISRITILSSTTSFYKFDREIVQSTSRWKFNSVNSNENDIMTIPFTFAE